MDLARSAARPSFQSATRLEFQFLLDLFHSRDEFPEPANPGNLLLCFCKRHGGRRPPCPATGVPGDATLGTHGGVIADRERADDSSLPAHQDPITALATATPSGPRCDATSLGAQPVGW